jgi:hypothetical protein
MKEIEHGTVTGYANSKCRCERCREKWAEYTRLQRADKARAKRYSTKYDLSLDQYFEMVLRQGNRCGVCRRPQENFERDFFVDHDHQTGAVRGLLCPGCNAGLGLLGDSADGVMNALEYLRQYQQPVVIDPELVPIELESEANGLELEQTEVTFVRVGPSR